VGSIFNGHKLERKFTLHTVQNPKNQKSVFIPRWKSKIKKNNDVKRGATEVIHEKKTGIEYIEVWICKHGFYNTKEIYTN
jgi:hypothetical protein